jgi:hypothetical protein
LEGSILNQVEIAGFKSEKEAGAFRRKLKSLNSLFKVKGFKAEEASWKMKDDFSLVYLFITEDSYPREEIKSLIGDHGSLEVQHLVLSPSGCGEMIHHLYSSGTEEISEYSGPALLMLGDLIKGGFQ